MKKLNLLFIILILFGCHKINDHDLTVVDKIVLGEKKESFYKQLDSLHLKSQTFYCKHLFTDINEINNSRLNLYYSEVFNTGKYNKSEYSIYHYGIIYPSLNSNSYVTGMYLLLAYTAKAVLIPSLLKQCEITEKTQILGLSQYIRADLLDEIQEMLTTKYGQPTEILNSKDSYICVIEKGSINKYISDKKYSGEIVKWKTKYLNISFFRGVRTNSTTFDTNGGGYLISMFPNEKKELGKNETYTYQLPYIYYEINDNTIKELKLNEVNL